MHKSLILLIISVGIAYAVVCAPNYCDSVKCKPKNCKHNQVYKNNGSLCGCCPVCIDILQKGESCKELFMLQSSPMVRCAKGLRCHAESRTCEE
ncbi:hypothetical protein HNY73_013115 [Argiope bruennichi]|uniref:Uncharacterized protein n=1 Tax=Argiope bruennichi TaxID=94029 RepID=A0A8T0EYN9_ARGBR|nr:hypothetical protein HNY73_013115 [Argiope bruennichi]